MDFRMKYTILTLFPEIIDAYFANSIMAKALARGIMEYRTVNIRDYATDKHHTCDDAPYGGGAGMLMLAEPLGRALEAAGAKSGPRNGGSTQSYNSSVSPDVHVICLTPSGKPFNQARARELAGEKELILICGRYEGIDQRIIDCYADEEISVGDYVLSSGSCGACCN